MVNPYISTITVVPLNVKPMAIIIVGSGVEVEEHILDLNVTLPPCYSACRTSSSTSKTKPAAVRRGDDNLPCVYNYVIAALVENRAASNIVPRHRVVHESGLSCLILVYSATISEHEIFK